VVGDVSDKGLPAALFMALTFSLVRAETGKTGDPARILQSVNRYLLNMNTAGMFVTLLLGILDFASGKLDYCRAGHLPPLILDGCGEFVNVPVSNGQPLGVLEHLQIDRQEVQIPAGGMMLLFSDGLTEAVDPMGQEYGLAAVKLNLAANRMKQPAEICASLWEAVRLHSGEQGHQDDFTTVVIKRS